MEPNPKGRPPKPAKDKAESFLHIRVNTRDKAAWVKAAQREGIPLAQWVIKRLN